MAKTMTPSAQEKEMTAKQINKAVSNYRAMLEKHVSEFKSSPAQIVLGQEELAQEQFEVFRRRVEAASIIIWREVEVDYTLTPEELIELTGRQQYVNPQIVATMPRLGEGKVKKLVGFFPLQRWTSVQEFEQALALHNLTYDPYAHAAANIADRAFADDHPNCGQWNVEGKVASFLGFRRWGGGRRVSVHRRDVDWSDIWGACGVSK